MNEVKVFFFATFRDRVGSKEAIMQIKEGITVGEFRDTLPDHFPALDGALDAALVAINKDFAMDDQVIPPGAELAVFPPVSGGSDFPTICSIVEGQIDLDAILAEITLPTTGAACFFSGMVRAVTARDDPHETEYLEYEAYQEMAEAKMQQVAGEIRQQWPAVEGIAIMQRIGVLHPGTPTVLIACSAGHRDTGVFEAARYGIDRLKQIVPVWKKEVGPNGQTWVEGDFIPQKDDK